MSVSINFNGTIIEDESGINDSAGDDNVTAATFNPATGFNAATAISGAMSGDNMPSPMPNTTYFPTYAELNNIVSFTGATGTPTVLFSDINGKPLNRANSALTADDGTAAGTPIYLYTSPANNLVVYGVAQSAGQTGLTQGTLVFAITLQETTTSGNLTGGNFWIEQWYPIHNSTAGTSTNGGAASPAGSFDEPAPLIAGALFVSARQDELFNDFSKVPSGDLAWFGLGPSSTTAPNAPDILVTGLNAGVDTVNTSQTGIGTDSQTVKYLQTVRIDFVDGALLPNGSQAKSESALSYTGGRQDGTGGGWSPVQTNPTNSLLDAKMVAYEVNDGSQQGTNYFNQIDNNLPGKSGDGTQSQAVIQTVNVYTDQSETTKIGSVTNPYTTASPPTTSTATVTLGTVGKNTITVTFDSTGAATVNNIQNLNQVTFSTVGAMNRFTVENVTTTANGKTNVSFDVGNIAALGTAFSSSDASLQVKFEDDGPTAALARSSITLSHDEGLFRSTGASDIGTLGSLFTAVTNPSTDYQNDNPNGYFGQSNGSVVDSTGTKSGADYVGATTVYAVSIASEGADSGLQTTDGHSILLHQVNSNLVVGNISGGASDGQTAIALYLDPKSGVLSLAEYASLKHGTADTNTESHEPLSIKPGALFAVVTETDGDSDVATAQTDIGNAVKILDDGPTAKIALTGAAVAHDETAGVQAANGANDTTSMAVANLFSGVATVATGAADLALPINSPDDRFAQSASAVVTANGSSVGADEEGVTGTPVFSLADPKGADSGLKATYAQSTPILLYLENRLVVGRVGSQAGPAAFAVELDPSTGVISTAQYVALVQTTASLGDNSESTPPITAGALNALVTLTDGDGDTATNSVDIGSKISFLDDGPTIGTIDNGSVLFKAGQSVSGNLNDASGVDGFAGPAGEQITAGSFTTPLTLTDGTTKLTGTLSNNNTVVTYKDSNNVSFFHLTLNGPAVTPSPSTTMPRQSRRR